MKLAKLLRLSSLMSSGKPRQSALAEAKIRELFGEADPVSASSELVKADKLLLKKSK